LRMHRNEAGEAGFEVLVGGGQGRTPVIAKTIRPFLPKRHLLSYLESILRIYNQLGRRDNLYKSRIKILVDSVGVDRFTQLVEEEWQQIRDRYLDLPAVHVARIRRLLTHPPYRRPASPA